jgi:hypothetical protein
MVLYIVEDAITNMSSDLIKPIISFESIKCLLMRGSLLVKN